MSKTDESQGIPFPGIRDNNPEYARMSERTFFTSACFSELKETIFRGRKVILYTAYGDYDKPECFISDDYFVQTPPDDSVSFLNRCHDHLENGVFEEEAWETPEWTDRFRIYKLKNYETGEFRHQIIDTKREEDSSRGVLDVKYDSYRQRPNETLEEMKERVRRQYLPPLEAGKLATLADLP